MKRILNTFIRMTDCEDTVGFGKRLHKPYSEKLLTIIHAIELAEIWEEGKFGFKQDKEKSFNIYQNDISTSSR